MGETGSLFLASDGLSVAREACFLSEYILCKRKETVVRTKFLGRLLCVIVLLGLSGAAFALPVPLPNPGAEKIHSDRADRPADVGVWTSGGVNASFSRDAAVKRSGQASFHIVNNGRPDAPKGAAQSAIFIVEGDVVPGLEYTITGWVKTKDVVEGDAGFHIRLKSDKGWLDGMAKNAMLKGTNDWTQITASFSAPPGAVKYNLFLSARYKGEAWFDDIEIHDNLESWGVVKFSELQETLARLDTQARELSPAAPARELERLAGGVAKAQKLLAQIQKLPADRSLSLAARRRFVDEAAALEAIVSGYARSLSVQKALSVATDLEGFEPAFVVGFAPPTMHVFLEDIAVDLEITNEKRILAVRGETEAAQIVILPIDDDLANVSVSVSDLTGDAGTLPASAVTVNPVGFVKTEILAGANPYPREADYLGWWPDPVLPNFPFDVAKGTSQPVRIEVRVPREISAGLYAGTIAIVADGDIERSVAFAVEVADVTLPRMWRFKSLLSWHEDWAKKFYKERWNDALHEKFFDFLLDRRINVISMYGNEPYATTENLIRFAKRGQNVLMLASLHPQAHVIKSKAAGLRARLDSLIPAMKEAGVLDRCIVYGWDERGPDWHDEIRYCAEMLMKDYGGLPLMMAGTDAAPGTFGTNSSLKGLPNIIYCPPMQHYNVDLAARANANGNKVWWYEVWWIIEDPLIRSRLIPWQSYKVGADGFLFWCLNRFVGNDKPVFDPDHPKTRTDWNPALDGGYENSTAMYIYPGKNGPISSLRLESFRDGIEDYELLVLARDLLADLEKREAADAAVVENLRKATTLEDDFVKDHADYSRDPSLLENHRRTLIRAIEAALSSRE